MPVGLDPRLRRAASAALFVAALSPGAASVAAGEPTDDADLVARVDALEAEQRQSSVRRGSRIFARSCAACHGPQGRGDGPAADDLDPRPRDLTSSDYRFRSTSSGDVPRVEDLERTIRAGLPGSSMPAFDDLFSRAEMDALVAFVESLHGRVPESSVLIGELPAATERTVGEGHALYLLLDCWTCHGRDGSGRGPSARALTDGDGRPIRATDFRHDPLKGGRDPAAIVRTLSTGLNGAPMPSYADAVLFAREDFPDVSSFAERLPAGDVEVVRAYVEGIATRAEIEALDGEDRRALRDGRLAALAHYVLSLDRRRSAWNRLFRQEPEREARP